MEMCFIPEMQIGRMEAVLFVVVEMLMSIVQGYESNAGIANYYQGSLFELEKSGALVEMEDEINSLTAENIRRVAEQIFEKAPPIVFHNTPTMTYTQLGVGLGVFGLVLLALLIRRVLRYRKTRQGS